MFLQMRIPLAARSQGSKNAYVRGGKVVMVEADKKFKVGRDQFIAHLIGQKRDWIKPDPHMPIHIQISFNFARPKSVQRRWKTTVPDVDKLARFIFDCLVKADLLDDDKQIVSCVLNKNYADEDSTEITMMQMDFPEDSLIIMGGSDE